MLRLFDPAWHVRRAKPPLGQVQQSVHFLRRHRGKLPERLDTGLVQLTRIHRANAFNIRQPFLPRMHWHVCRLADRWDDLPEQRESERTWQIVDALLEIGQARGKTPSQVALTWRYIAG